MPRRYLLLALSLLVAAVCVRLGFWQVSRLQERRRMNAEAAQNLALPAVDVATVGSGGPIGRFRRVRADGSFDYSREIVLTARSRKGSPGVHVITPLVRSGTDTLLLVLRGWVYSPDAATIEPSRWREPVAAQVEGYGLPIPPGQVGSDSSTVTPHALRRLDRELLEKRFGAPVTEYYVVMTGSDSLADSVPARLGDPALSEGSHLSYAVQWFFFAVVFGAGGTLVVLRGRPKPTASS